LLAARRFWRREIDVVDRKSFWALAAGAIAAALLAVSGLVATGPADAEGGCGESCRAAYNQCRIATKGSSACEAAFTSCMQQCIKRH
jgi:hypothetical protein